MLTRPLTLWAALLIPTIANAQGFGDSMQPYSSTADEGVQRGYADIVRSYGMANLLTGQAANQYEQARKQYIENRIRATHGYFELQRYMAEVRESMRPRPLSLEQYVRLAREEAPAPLTATQLDQLTGDINWPAILRKAEYEPLRRRIERLFQDRATGYAVYGEIPAACNAFAEQLQADIMLYPSADYIAARRFLDSLAFSARGVQG